MPTLPPHLQVLEWVDMEPVVLYKGIKGSPMKSNVLVRVHDQCFTSEVMGSRRCDCREQLELAMDMVQKQGGAIIYLPQEGRGIGLANKVAAYHLQDQGLDTVDANRRLGFDDDERVYGCVPFILRDRRSPTRPFPAPGPSSRMRGCVRQCRNPCPQRSLHHM